MLDILKTAIGRLVNSQRRLSFDETADEGSYWENELALFAPMEFPPAGQHRRTRLEPKDSAPSQPRETEAAASPAPSHKLAEPV